MKRKKVSLIRFLLLACITLSGVVAFSTDSQAIPAFMRKYQTACTTCHWATFPKLNSFGRAFRNNGYRIPVGDEAFVKDEPVVLGARPWKKLFPNAVWPGDTPGLPPIGIEMKSDFIYRIDQRSPGFDLATPTAKLGNVVDTDFTGITELKLNTGGTLGDTISFFGVFTLLQDGQAANNITRFAGIERAFLAWNPYVFGEQGLINVRVGQFEIRAVPFPFHREINRISFPIVNNTALFEDGNFHGMSPNQRGIEIFGAKDGPNGRGGLEWAVGVVNGDLGPVTEQMLRRGGFVEDSPQWKILSREHDTFDFNTDKDWYVRASWKFGGAGVLGHEDETEELKLTKNWQDNSVKIGFTYYQGVTGSFMAGPQVGGLNGQIGRPDRPDLPLDLDNIHFKRFGADIDAFWGDFNFKGQLMFNEDRAHDIIRGISGKMGNPALLTVTKRGSDRFKWRTTLVAVEWVAKPWLIPAIRYQRIDYIDNKPVIVGGNPRQGNRGRVDHVQNISIDTTFLLRPNLKLLMGYVISDKPPENFKAPGVISDFFRIGVDFSL